MSPFTKSLFSGKKIRIESERVTIVSPVRFQGTLRDQIEIEHVSIVIKITIRGFLLYS